MSANSPRRRLLASSLASVLLAGGAFVGAALAQGAAPVAVEEASIARDAFSTGMLGPAAGGFGDDLWDGASAADLEMLLALAPARPSSPAMGGLLQRLLLTPAAGPAGAPPSLGGRKLIALVRAGHADDARTIASLSSAPTSDPWVNEALAVADLLDADLDAACRRRDRVNSGRDGMFWVKLRVLCHAAGDEFDSADLTLGILREQGALSETDDLLLSAASIPAPLKAAVAPTTALQLAALRRLNGVAAPGFENAADAGVLLSVARSGDLDPRRRLMAAVHAAAAGAGGAAELRQLFASVDVGVDAGLDAADVLSDAARYQVIAAVQGPEFVRDRAVLIAEAINAAPTFARSYSAALVYGRDVADLEGVIVGPKEAGAFALVAMATGRSDAAGRWLLAMSEGGFDGLPEEDALRFIDLVNLLGVLNRREAEIVAAAANVRIDPPRLALAPPQETDREKLGAIVGAAIDAASADARGQLALAAIALSDRQYAGDAVAERVSAAALSAADLDDLRRQHQFEAAWAAGFPESTPAAAVAGAEPAGFSPSIKPKNPQ